MSVNIDEENFTRKTYKGATAGDGFFFLLVLFCFSFFQPPIARIACFVNKMLPPPPSPSSSEYSLSLFVSPQVTTLCLRKSSSEFFFSLQMILN